MTRYLVAAHTAATMFVSQAREHLRGDDRGAVTTETAIITGILVVAALGLTAAITGVIDVHQNMISTGGGGE